MGKRGLDGYTIVEEYENNPAAQEEAMDILASIIAKQMIADGVKAKTPEGTP